jgi:aspartate aminotransferase-like enzyme
MTEVRSVGRVSPGGEKTANDEGHAPEGLFDPFTSTFLLAGPVRLHPRVQQAMATPSLNHRGEYFHEIVAEIKELLPLVFGRPGHQVVLTGSGTCGLEAMVSNLARREDRVVVVNNGHFGDRLEKIVGRFAHAVPVRGPWGRPVDSEAVAAALETPGVVALAAVYNETSVGFTNPVAPLAERARRRGVPLWLDAISALPGLPPPPDEWGVEAMVVGSQKGLAAPPGLALVHLSTKARERLVPQTFSTDLVEHLKSLEKNDTPFTPAVPLFLALREALLLLKEEGPDRRRRRTHDVAKATRAAVRAMGLELYPPVEHASDTVTAIRYPAGVDDASFRGALRTRHNVIVSGGQGQARGQIFRLGHMGIASFMDLLVGVAAVERELYRAGRIPELGAGVREFLTHVP